MLDLCLQLSKMIDKLIVQKLCLLENFSSRESCVVIVFRPRFSATLSSGCLMKGRRMKLKILREFFRLFNVIANHANALLQCGDELHLPVVWLAHHPECVHFETLHCSQMLYHSAAISKPPLPEEHSETAQIQDQQRVLCKVD